MDREPQRFKGVKDLFSRVSASLSMSLILSHCSQPLVWEMWLWTDSFTSAKKTSQILREKRASLWSYQLFPGDRNRQLSKDLSGSGLRVGPEERRASQGKRGCQTSSSTDVHYPSRRCNSVFCCPLQRAI